jgi:O-antigen/teichoic acid export membrane protein
MSVARNTIFNLGGAILPLLLSIVTVPIYLHLVGQERFGVLAIVWLLLGYFGLFDLGTGRAIQYRIAGLNDAPKQVTADAFWSALMLNVMTSLIAMLAMWAAAHFFFATSFKATEIVRLEALKSVPILALSVPVAMINGVLTGALQGREKFLQTNIMSIVSTALFQVLPLFVAWHFGPALPGLILAALSARFIALVLLQMQCHREFLTGVRPSLLWREVKTLFSYGGWVLLTAIIGPMLVIVDRFWIGATLGAAAVALYSIPYQLTQRLALFPAALTNALFPKLSRASGAEHAVLEHHAYRLLLSSMTLIVLIVISVMGLFLHIWVGDRIGVQAAPVGRVLAAAFWANALALFFFIRLQAKGRPDLVTKILIAEVPFYWVALWFGMKYFGVLGCGLAFLFRCGMDFCIMAYFADRRIIDAGLVLTNGAMIGCALFLFEIFSADSWQIWVGCSLLITCCVAQAYITMPKAIWVQVRLLSNKLVGRTQDA